LTQNKAATFWGRGSVDVADAEEILSIQVGAQARPTRSLPKAGIGKEAEMGGALFHPEDEVTPGSRRVASG
jgi:hypothetical protein